MCPMALRPPAGELQSSDGSVHPSATLSRGPGHCFAQGQPGWGLLRQGDVSFWHTALNALGSVFCRGSHSTMKPFNGKISFAKWSRGNNRAGASGSRWHRLSRLRPG